MERIELNFMKQIMFIFFCQVFLLLVHGQNFQGHFTSYSKPLADTFFWQEYHQGFNVGKDEGDNDVRSIAIDESSNIWIATAAGIFMKNGHEDTWSPVIEETSRGPAYAVLADNEAGIWMGTWDGVYQYHDHKLQKIEGVEGPVSVLCKSQEGIYALGPKGVWLISDHHFQKKNYSIARSVQNAISDGNGGLWIATKIGLYHCSEKKHYIIPGYYPIDQRLYRRGCNKQQWTTLGRRFGWGQHQAK